MRPLAVSILCAVLTSASPPTGRASFPRYFDVAQPMATLEAYTVGVYRVTYFTYTGEGIAPGMEILWTCAESPPVFYYLAPLDSSAHAMLDGSNVARDLGFVVRMNRPLRVVGGPTPHVDTVAVTLDVAAAADSFLHSPRALREMGGSAGFRRKFFRDVVEATIEAIMDNASRSSSPIHHVALRVKGPREYAALSEVRKVMPAPRRYWK